MAIMSCIGLCGSVFAAAQAQEPAQEPEVLRGLSAGCYSAELAQIWLLCAETGGARIRAFDALLREAPPPAAGIWETVAARAVPAAPTGEVELAVWGGRRLRATARGIEVSAQPWELAPWIEWGPGWATVEVRSTLPLRELRWRRVGDAEEVVAPFAADRGDGIRQRARLRGLDAGQRIEVALPAWRQAWPTEAPAWAVFAVPEVDPAGPRPTSAWPRR